MHGNMHRACMRKLQPHIRCNPSYFWRLTSIAVTRMVPQAHRGTVPLAQPVGTSTGCDPAHLVRPTSALALPGDCASPITNRLNFSTLMRQEPAYSQPIIIGCAVFVRRIPSNADLAWQEPFRQGD